MHLLHPAFSQVAHLDWELDISHKRAEKYKEEPTLLLDGSIDHIMQQHNGTIAKYDFISFFLKWTSMSIYNLMVNY